MPAEDLAHEGTWLQWPHNYGWDSQHKQRYEAIWIAMAKALHTGEKVHIIVYNETEKVDVTNTLTNEGLDMNQIDFLVAKTDDVWVRDNGPIFVKDANNDLKILNWKFNGWGQKSEYLNDNQIPTKVSENINIDKVDINMVLEGGAVEIDGNGTLLAKRSCIINNNRNPGLTQTDVENYFRVNFGVTNFVWMDGVKGQDITDDHIDFAARFANEGTIVYTHPDLLNDGEVEILQNARDKDGNAYTLVELPITQEIQSGANIQGVYTNFYVGNSVVLVPNYNSPTDATANNIIQSLYPNKTVVGIDVRELYKDGGAIHCVTQQQPVE
jgi:agmatine deiminase